MTRAIGVQYMNRAKMLLCKSVSAYNLSSGLKLPVSQPIYELSATCNIEATWSDNISDNATLVNANIGTLSNLFNRVIMQNLAETTTDQFSLFDNLTVRNFIDLVWDK